MYNIEPNNKNMSGRIYEGTKANRNLPYQVLVYLKYRNTLFPYCGGTLITLNYILTARHCLAKASGFNDVKHDPSLIYIKAGSTTISVSNSSDHTSYVSLK